MKAGDALHAVAHGSTEDVEALFAEMAWCRARSVLGDVDRDSAEARGEMQRQIGDLAEVMVRVQRDLCGHREEVGA